MARGVRRFHLRPSPVASEPDLVLTGAATTRVARRRARQAPTIAIAGRDRACAAGHVIPCGGAINPPQLLMLSGIGPAARVHMVPQQFPPRRRKPAGPPCDSYRWCPTRRSPTTRPTIISRCFLPASDLHAFKCSRGRWLCVRVSRSDGLTCSFHFVPAFDDHGREIAFEGFWLHLVYGVCAAGRRAAALTPHSPIRSLMPFTRTT